MKEGKHEKSKFRIVEKYSVLILMLPRGRVIWQNERGVFSREEGSSFSWHCAT